ncbi:DUF541 domain-containing protein [Candidatus Parcubacteria bacterium]|nr:MAG: DUF541 domain-containing protein [Candidatus Parcubacteria bacterium]
MNTDRSKSYFWMLINLLIAGLIINLVFFVMPAVKAYRDSIWPVRTINVSAEGRAVATPDLAETSFSVVSKGRNPEELADNNNQKVSAAIEFIKSQGIDTKDVKTSGYNLSPDYRYDPKTERNFITGYTLTQTVNVKIRDLGKVAAVIGGLTPLGVNQIGGINFTIDDPEKLLGEARADAFRRAHEKAKTMAGQNGLRLGKIVNVNEFSGGPPMPYFAAKDMAMGMGGPEMMVARPTIEPGTQEITVNVSITYALR